MTSFFTYFQKGRLAHAWPALVAGLAMLALAAEFHAPLWVWALMIPCLSICLFQMAVRPLFGIRLTAHKLLIYNGLGESSVPLCLIKHLRVSQGSYVIVLASGQEITLPEKTLPDPLSLIRELTARDIPVRALSDLEASGKLTPMKRNRVGS